MADADTTQHTPWAPSRAAVKAHASLRDDDLLRQLARDIAMDIVPLDDLMKRYDLSELKLEELKTNHRFVAYLADAVAQWSDPGNVQERIKVKALAMIEEALPDMYAAMVNPMLQLNHRVAVLQQVSKLAGLGGTEREGEIDPSSRISISINMGDGQDVKFAASKAPIIEGIANE